MRHTRESLLHNLYRLKITNTTHDHPAVFTVEESAKIKADLPGGHTKNLFLKDKQGQMFLICALADTQIPVNKLHREFGCKRLSFGKPDLLLEHLGVAPGSVTLFSVINDTQNQVALVLDQALFSHELVNFHPLENTATTAISAEDMTVFAKAHNHDPVIIDFTQIE